MDELFGILKEMYENHKNAAKAIGVSERTYTNWRKNNLHRPSQKAAVEALLRDHIKKHSHKGSRSK